MPFVMSGIISVFVIKNIALFQNMGFYGSFLFWVLISISMGISLVPTSFVALISGYLWGFSTILPLIISYILATSVGFYLSKVIDNNFILQELDKNTKAKNLLNNLKTEQFKIIALARLSPIFPFGISNVIFTYLGVPLKNLILAGIIGMLPRTLLMIWASTKIEVIQNLFNSNWKDNLQSPIFYLGVLSMGGLVYIFLRAKKSIDK
jgi:uncharacterized membrane protein YdjX (TVP38/TMEM64 family)